MEKLDVLRIERHLFYQRSAVTTRLRKEYIYIVCNWDWTPRRVIWKPSFVFINFKETEKARSTNRGNSFFNCPVVKLQLHILHQIVAKLVTNFRKCDVYFKQWCTVLSSLKRNNALLRASPAGGWTQSEVARQNVKHVGGITPSRDTYYSSPQ
jgi:hypothetical protein